MIFWRRKRIDENGYAGFLLFFLSDMEVNLYNFDKKLVSCWKKNFKLCGSKNTLMDSIYKEKFQSKKLDIKDAFQRVYTYKKKWKALQQICRRIGMIKLHKNIPVKCLQYL